MLKEQTQWPSGHTSASHAVDAAKQAGWRPGQKYKRPRWMSLAEWTESKLAANMRTILLFWELAEQHWSINVRSNDTEHEWVQQAKANAAIADCLALLAEMKFSDRHAFEWLCRHYPEIQRCIDAFTRIGGSMEPADCLWEAISGSDPQPNEDRWREEYKQPESADRAEQGTTLRPVRASSPTGMLAAVYQLLLHPLRIRESLSSIARDLPASSYLREIADLSASLHTSSEQESALPVQLSDRMVRALDATDNVGVAMHRAIMRTLFATPSGRITVDKRVLQHTLLLKSYKVHSATQVPTPIQQGTGDVRTASCLKLPVTSGDLRVSALLRAMSRSGFTEADTAERGYKMRKYRLLEYIPDIFFIELQRTQANIETRFSRRLDANRAVYRKSADDAEDAETMEHEFFEASGPYTFTLVGWLFETKEHKYGAVVAYTKTLWHECNGESVQAKPWRALLHRRERAMVLCYEKINATTATLYKV